MVGGNGDRLMRATEQRGRMFFRQRCPNGRELVGPVVQLGFWDDKACDRCGAVGSTCLINGVGRQDWSEDERHPGFAQLTTLAEYTMPPKRLLEFSIALCRACVHLALERMDPHPRRQAAPVAVNGERVVYFIQSGVDGPIKVGTANDPGGRLASLQTGSPHELIGLGIVTGGRDVEAAFHVRFRAHRLRGEWFSPAEEILRCIAEETLPWPALAIPVLTDDEVPF